MVEVTITINGTEMPYEDARQLYEQLKEIFYKPTTINWPPRDYNKKWEQPDGAPYWKYIPDITCYSTKEIT